MADSDKVHGSGPKIPSDYNKERKRPVDPDKFKRTVEKVSESDETQKRHKRKLKKVEEEGDENGADAQGAAPPNQQDFQSYMSEETSDDLFDSESKAAFKSSKPPRKIDASFAEEMGAPSSTKGRNLEEEKGGILSEQEQSAPLPSKSFAAPSEKAHKPNEGYQSQEKEYKSDKKPTSKEEKQLTKQAKASEHIADAEEAFMPLEEAKAPAKRDKLSKSPKEEAEEKQARALPSKGEKTFAGEEKPYEPPAATPKKEKPQKSELPHKEEQFAAVKTKKQQEYAPDTFTIQVVDKEAAEIEKWNIKQKDWKKHAEEVASMDVQTQQMPIPATHEATPTNAPIYTHLSPEVFELFDKMVGLITIVKERGITSTSVELKMPGSIFNNAELVFQRFDTAPDTLYLEFRGSPEAVTLFTNNLTDLSTALEQAQLPYQIDIKTPILQQPDTRFTRKGSGDQDSGQQKRKRKQTQPVKRKQ